MKVDWSELGEKVVFWGCALGLGLFAFLPLAGGVYCLVGEGDVALQRGAGIWGCSWACGETLFAVHAGTTDRKQPVWVTLVLYLGIIPFAAPATFPIYWFGGIVYPEWLHRQVEEMAEESGSDR